MFQRRLNRESENLFLGFADDALILIHDCFANLVNCLLPYGLLLDEAVELRYLFLRRHSSTRCLAATGCLNCLTLSTALLRLCFVDLRTLPVALMLV